MQIAEGSIDISLNDGDAMAGLDRVEAEFKAKMAAIGRTEARAQIDAETRKFDEAIDRVKAKLAALKAERAEVVVGANKDELDKKIAAAELAITRLNGRKAEVKIEVQGAEKALAQEAAIAKAESDRQKAYQAYASQRDAIIRKEQASADKAASQLARDTASKAKAYQADERAAYKINEIKNREPLEEARRLARIESLRKQYSEQTSKVESVQRITPGIFATKEIKEKINIDVADATAKLLMLREEIKALGGTVPVHMKVDDNLLARTKATLGDFFGSLATKAANIGNVRINAGPISGTLRSLGAAAATLLPVITSLGGSLVSLVGVLGTGLAGAASVGGGVLAGLALNLGGVFAAVKPVISEFEAARAATTAFSTAVQKYGSDSKQAKKAQEAMNNTLKSVSPQARDAAVGIAVIGQRWRELTGQTAKLDIGTILANSVKTAAALMPGLARNTDATLGIIREHVDSVMAHLRQPAEVHMFDSLGKSANQFLGPALGGLERLGAAFLHVGSTAARIFAGSAGKGFEHWAEGINQATQPGAKLDAEIARIGDHAKDLLHFFSSLGSVIATVLNGSANAGDNFINSMSKGLNKWNEFLSSTRGKNDMAKFFSESVKGTEALWGIVAPLTKLMFSWAAGLTPFVNEILKIAQGLTNVFVGLGKFIGLNNPLATLGATLGVLFAVNKIEAFIGMLVKAVSLVKELGAIGTLKALATGGLGAASSMAGGAASAGATIASAMEAAGSAVAAEIRAAMTEGGAVAGAEAGAGETAGGAAAGIEGAAGAAAGSQGRGVVSKVLYGTRGKAVAPVAEGAAEAGEATGAAEGFSGALAGLGIDLAPETLGISALVAGVGVLALHLLGGQKAAHQMADSISELGAGFKDNTENAQKVSGAWGHMSEMLTNTGTQLHQSNLSLKEAKTQLNSTRAGTEAHERAELQYNEALRSNMKLRTEWNKQSKETHEAANTAVEDIKSTMSETEKLKKQKEVDIHNAKVTGDTEAEKNNQKELGKIESKRADEASKLNKALNLQAAVNATLARSYRGLPELSAAATQAVGSLARTQGGQAVAAKVAVKFTTTGSVQNIAAEAQKALGAGVKSNVVLKVVADASSAKDALSSLSKIQLAAKIQHISANDGPKVVAMLRSIDGVHLSTKEAKIISSGGPAAVAMLDHILGIKIPNKHTSLSATDGISALAAKAMGAIRAIPTTWHATVSASVSGLGSVQSLQSAIFGVQSKAVSITATTYKNEVVNKSFGPAPHAEGGIAEKTYGGMYNKPTLLVGEESRNEYVIATNPAYRDNNVQYLKEAANELGVNIDEAAKGAPKKKKAAPKTKGKASPQDPGFSALKVPAGYEAAGVPEGPVNKVVSSIESSLKSEKSKLAALLTSLPKSQKELTDAKNAEATAKKAKASKTKAKNVHTAVERREKAAAKVHQEHEGIRAFRSGGEYEHKTFPSITELEREKDKAVKDKESIERANNEITHLNSVIATDQTRLGNAASRYNGSKGKDAGALTEWEGLLSSKRGTINQLLGILNSAKKTAAGVKPKNTELEKLIDELESTSAAAETNANEVSEAEASGPGGSSAGEPAASTPEEGPPSAEKFVENLGLKEELASLNEAYALAQTNNVPDNPNTPENEEIPSLLDDVATSQSLEKFWENILTDAKAAKAPAETITDIANSVTAARSTYQGLNEKVNEDTASAATNAYNDMVNFSQARNELYENFGSNFAPVWSKPSGVSVPGTPSLTGGAGTNAVGQMPQGNTVNMNVTNHFQQPPPEPHAWSQGVAWELGAAI